MEVLYVEDEENKAKQVVQLINDNVQSVEIVFKHSFNSAMDAINKQEYELILLDMTLPLYDISEATELETENDVETFAGIDLLEELVRLDRKTKVIIITAFDVLGEDENRINLSQLDEKMKWEYNDNYIGVIYYNSSSLEWCHKLLELIKLV